MVVDVVVVGVVPFSLLLVVSGVELEVVVGGLIPAPFTGIELLLPTAVVSVGLSVIEPLFV